MLTLGGLRCRCEFDKTQGLGRGPKKKGKEEEKKRGVLPSPPTRWLVMLLRCYDRAELPPSPNRVVVSLV